MITGPTSGIGLAFARALAAEGHDLVLVSRDETRLRELAAELTARHGVGCEALPADLADLDQTKTVEQRLGSRPVDVLVNNAGFGLAKPFHHHDVEVEQRGLDVMVRAVMRLTHAALGPMVERGRGDIVNVSSVAGFLPRGTYGAHKAWVTSFSSWASLRYRKDGVRVIAVCPGFVRTEFHQRMDGHIGWTPGWLWLDADDVVHDALEDLREGRAISVPSARYKALVGVSRIAPRRWVEKASRRGR